MPVCRMCGEDKDVEAFALDRGRRRTECRRCQYARNKANRRAHMARDPEYKARHLGKGYARRRALNYTALHKASSVEAALRSRLYSLRKTAAARGKFEVALTPEDMLRMWADQAGKCALTSRPLALPGTPGYCGPDTLSVDRVDSSLGYVPGNVRFVTIQANAARGAGSDAALLQFCRDVIASFPRPAS